MSHTLILRSFQKSQKPRTWRTSMKLVRPLRPPSPTTDGFACFSYFENEECTGPFHFVVIPPPQFLILYNLMMSFSRTTLGFNRISVRRPFPAPSHILFPTPTSVVPTILSRFLGVDQSLDPNSLVILFSSNTVFGASNRRDMSLDVTSTMNANSKRCESRIVDSIPSSPTVRANLNEC